jgi:hypothetical protein
VLCQYDGADGSIQVDWLLRLRFLFRAVARDTQEPDSATSKQQANQNKTTTSTSCRIISQGSCTRPLSANTS